jgi:hypothetical protein
MTPIARMLRPAAITVVFTVMAFAVFVPSVLMQQQGGPYVLNPSVIAGGGGTSTNGSTKIALSSVGTGLA